MDCVYLGLEREGLLMEVEPPRQPSGHPDAALGVTLLRIDGPAWDAALADAPRSVFHGAGYHRYTQGFGHGEPYLAVVDDGGQGVAWPYILRPVSEVPSLAGTGAMDVSSVYGYPGPVVWGCRPGDRFVDDALTSIADTWRRQRAVSAFTRFNPLLGNASIVPGLSAQPGGISADGVVAAGSTVSVDLGLDDARIRVGFGRGLARDIAAGRIAGLRTIHDMAWRHLPTFAELYRENMRRLGASEFYYFADDDFRRLRAMLPDEAHLLVTLSGETVAAAGIFLESGTAIEWHLAGANSTMLDISPSKVLIDDAVRWARARGFRAMHLGGGRGGREDSLWWFKSRFSPLRHPFAIGRWVLDPRAYAELTDARAAAVPEGGRPDHSFFPAYRAPLLNTD